MKRFIISTISLLFLLAGCTDYARKEDIRLGMTVSEITEQTPCFYRGGSGAIMRYSCQLDVPAGQYLEGRSIIPYILTFENGRLQKIALDESERFRQTVRYRYYYGYPGYWYGGYGYPGYGYPGYGYRGYRYGGYGYRRYGHRRHHYYDY